MTRDDLLQYARAKNYITDDELAAGQATITSLDAVQKAIGGPQKYTEIMAKTTVDVLMSFEVPARRTKKEGQAGMNEEQLQQ